MYNVQCPLSSNVTVLHSRDIVTDIISISDSADSQTLYSLQLSISRTKQTAQEHQHTLTHTHPFNAALSGTTQVSQYQKGKTNLKQETVSGSGISWAMCKSAPHSRQITMPASHQSVFYRPDALPAAQPTYPSKH